MGPCQFSYGKHFKYANQILCLPGAAAGRAGGSHLSPRPVLLPASPPRFANGGGKETARCVFWGDLSKNKEKTHYVSLSAAVPQAVWYSVALGKGYHHSNLERGHLYFISVLFFW